MVRAILEVVAHTLLLGAWCTASLGCDSGDPNTGALRGTLETGCTVASDCNAPLICVLGRCHTACETSRDCPMGARCIKTGTASTCELEGDRRACFYVSDCAAPLVCGVDGQCRSECKSVRDCVEGQVCSFGTCAYPPELVDGSLPFTARGRVCVEDRACPSPSRCLSGSCQIPCSDASACESLMTCSSGLCAPKAGCPAGSVACGGVCIDPLSNLVHCGATPGCGESGGAPGSTCASGEVCSAGTCALSCQVGLVKCDGTCVDPATSRSHCGATEGCGVSSGATGARCLEGHVCSSGACSLSCQEGLVNCAGICLPPAECQDGG